MPLSVKVLASLALVAAVLWWMWRMPPRPKSEALYGIAPALALVSIWAGLIGLVLSGVLWFVQSADAWLPWVFMLLYPLAVGGGVFVLWIYRGTTQPGESIDNQRMQARGAIVLGLIGVAIGYYFVMTHRLTTGG